MTPAARVQAAIEVLDRVIEAARSEGAPADRIIADWARSNRYAGSKDRRAVRELVYGAVRVCSEVPASGRAAMLRLADGDAALRDCFDGSQYGPALLAQHEPVAAAGAVPEWLAEALTASELASAEQAALMGRAPLDVRVNTLKADRATIALPEPGQALEAPQAMRFTSGTAVEQWPAYNDGLIEVQDHGSQLACLAAAVQPGETVIDLCAGAGGKTLALAAAMEGRGTLLACDTDKRRLGNLPPRSARAGAGFVQTLLLDPGRELEVLDSWRGTADCVFVDAPCSGTGTLRRQPEGKWRLTPERLGRFAALQDHVLDLATGLVKPGGRLVFVTCSLLDTEGADRFAAFLVRHPEWRCDDPALPLGTPRGGGVRLTPAHDATDGFFIARAILPC
ncbi:RsmB/NOP family class I SAM-dependent RNA methyltransferase [Parerythrobacter aurantius]|uniref:RsmB/NOP family class I SAM-dependent RNA methyltransferase n=1 Tax=Parerythrobacter aurantius TaxID=3127706 RepID=UPI0032481465